ncbi:MAG: sugar phosphate isomerase/epimerase [Planctomycetes bacterium]|nr:sugar phosphate isomerase/epimerase [Planctomycetota bacterium]
MRFGYNTNGFAHHRLEDVLAILAELGYQSVAITLDYQHLNPFEPNLESRLAETRKLLDKLSLSCVIETGARFLLDSRNKHQPTLLSSNPADRQRRLDFLCRAVDVGHVLQADAVSFWSGAPRETLPFADHLHRLASGCLQLCEYAASKGVRLAFEPEPGMLIDTMDRFAALSARVDHPAFGLTIDIGHLHCQGETPVADHLRHWQGRLWNIHIEDMRRGIHEHVMFGEGEIDFRPVLRTLTEIGYAGGVHVELSRHGHDAVNVARASLRYLEEMNDERK